MNGPEHYAAAEELLTSCQLVQLEEGPEIYPPVGPGHEDDLDTCRNALMAAQVHATLAHTAALADLRIASSVFELPGAVEVTGDSLVDRDQGWPLKPDTWAGVIASTIGDQA